MNDLGPEDYAMKTDTLELPANTLQSEPETNMMKVRDRETIDKIEDSFLQHVII